MSRELTAPLIIAALILFLSLTGLMLGTLIALHVVQSPLACPLYNDLRIVEHIRPPATRVHLFCVYQRSTGRLVSERRLYWLK